jgi:hypothetical protein
MTKHKQTRKHQRGGDWNPMTWFNTSTVNSNRSWGDWFNGVSSQTTEGLNSISSNVGNVFNEATSFSTNSAQAYAPVSTQQHIPVSTQQYSPAPTYGGKRRCRKRLKGGTSVSYYASPVHNIKVAEPTSWLHYGTKGGSRRQRTRKRRH